MNRVLIDTNVLIYALDESSMFYTSASEILQNENTLFYITTKNISEFFAVCTKLKIDQQKMFGFYADLKNNTTTLYPDNQSLNILENLIQKYNPKGNRVYDVEIVSVMLANNLESIATFNVDDFKNITEIKLAHTT